MIYFGPWEKDDDENLISHANNGEFAVIRYDHHEEKWVFICRSGTDGFGKFSFSSYYFTKEKALNAASRFFTVNGYKQVQDAKLLAFC